MKAQITRLAALSGFAERIGATTPEALEARLRDTLSRLRGNDALSRAFWREAQHGGFW